jgi:mannose-6-phosphate isomerase-like protein (cupin superfamily)
MSRVFRAASATLPLAVALGLALPAAAHDHPAPAPPVRPAAAPAAKHLGRPFTLTQATPITELTRHPAGHFNRTVRIEGVVASCCTQEGCFIEVAPDGGGEGIVVNFADLAHLFPTDCIGARAVVEGMFYQKIYPAARVRHWQDHSFRPGKTVPEYSWIPRLTATAASVGDTRGLVPPPPDIVPARTDRVDLAVMEFEAEGFGTGRKVLAPGDSTETHGTGNTREMLFCLAGEVTVTGAGPEPVTLRPGEMSFIPPATKHALRNAGDRPAVYLFVYARRIEPEKPREP